MPKVKRCFIVLAIAFFVQASDAQEGKAPSKEKSLLVASVLAFDLIPGDALFYARRPVQGVFNTLLGGFGGTLFWYAVHAHASDKYNESQCLHGCGLQSPVGVAFSIAPYFGAMVWEFFAARAGVRAYNQKIKSGHESSNFYIAPAYMPGEEGVYIITAQGNF